MMKQPDRIALQEWKKEMPVFREKSTAFYAGEISQAEYKGFSGRYGSYAQRGGKASMLRLRMPGGRVTKEKLAFVTDMIRTYQVDRIHFTTCQTIQFHDLQQKALCDIMDRALEAGIVTMGAGGDFPRNVMCSPLSGVERGEYFDVLPWAEAAGEYLMRFINAAKMPRKLKVGFSNSPQNVPHATYRDLGFVATPSGKFDVYSAGGLGNNARFGVKVAGEVMPEQILYYIRAMWLTFCAYGDYENRARARTRYMQERLGGADEYRKAFREKLEEALQSGEELDLTVQPRKATKQGDGVCPSGARITPQSQEGLYAVNWHPIGGCPVPRTLCALYEAISGMQEVELRLSPDESVYIINLTGREAKEILAVTSDGADTVFETSVSCIGASVCQVGLRDSQALLRACIQAVREARIPDGALPKIHISGCPSSCGTHQTGAIGFRGAVKRAGDKNLPGYALYVNGRAEQGNEQMGREIGILTEKDIPEFLVRLGRCVAETGLDFAAWNEQAPFALEELAQKYV